MMVDLEHGQKTGSFLDQRENRARFGALAAGARVLDLCCYTGGFALNALKGGAKEVIAVDTSAQALQWARRNLELNGYPPDAVRFTHGEAGELLGRRQERFDLIVLDPPPFARSRGDARRAEHLYVELNALALSALNPGGLLMTFSCSSHFRGEDFVRAVRIAEGRSGRRMRLLERLGPGPDHPVLLGHPEGEYLTGVLLRDLG
jgi:23S rRNA (cytosine1962-C5)-methyltransferase